MNPTFPIFGIPGWWWSGLFAVTTVTLALALIRWSRPRRRRWAWRSLASLIGVAGLLILAASGYWFWFFHRTPPAPEHRQLFPGVTYVRDVRQSPRPLVIHVVTIDLTTPGLGFVVTPMEPYQGHMLRAKTTSAFLRQTGCQIAINGGYFRLFKTGWGKEFPMTGDPVDPIGLGAARGQAYSVKTAFSTLYISETNQISMRQPIGPIYNAITGSLVIVEAGQSLRRQRGGPASAETALGLNKDHSRMILLVVDGKQPGYSEGVDSSELADLLIEYGVEDGMYFDGGGSSTLVVQGPDGQPNVLNVPCNLGLVGLERPVATHLGVFIPAAPPK